MTARRPHADLARTGNVEVSAVEFFERYDLNAIPLHDWARYRQRARSKIDTDLRLRLYDPTRDVRTGMARQLVRDWAITRPIFAFTAPSGAGKSWLLFAVGLELCAAEGLVVLVDATGDASNDLAQACQRFWQDIGGHGASTNFSAIAEQRKKIVPKLISRWLTILVNGVLDKKEAEDLARQNWEGLGVRLAISCSEDVERYLQSVAPGRVGTHRVGDFTEAELNGLLAARYGEEHCKIPRSVRELLRHPLLAGLYCEISGEPFEPRSPYQLYEAYWQRLSAPPAQDGDDMRLCQLPLALFDENAQYPWSRQRVILSLGEAAKRVQWCGWLRPAGSGDALEVPHDRLLSWLVAKALLQRFLDQHDDQAVNRMAARLSGLFDGVGPAERDLRPAVADFLYLLLDRAHAHEGRTEDLLLRLDRITRGRVQSVYRDILPAVDQTQHARLARLFSANRGAAIPLGP
jgi:hypothetical protein